jgi:hypothetical protein
VAVSVTCDPLLYAHPLEQDGLIVPPPAGLTAVVRVYCWGVVPATIWMELTSAELLGLVQVSEMVN